MKNKIRKANYFIGSKYYRYISDTELEVLRISRIKNENQVVAIKNVYKTDKTPELINKTTWDVPLEDTISFEYLSIKDLKENYTKLLSDGLMIFNIITIGDMEDVVVTLMRREDINNGIQVPYVICRQNVKDFHDYLIKADWGKTCVGSCISQDTIPNGCDFRAMLTADNVVCSNIVNVYIDDTLEDILKFVNTLNYDDCLKRIYELATKHAQTFNYPMPDGYCKTLVKLLEDNAFMDDFNRGFGLIKFPTVLDFKDNRLFDEDLQVLSDLTGKLYLGHFICAYDKTIDLSRISYDYILIKDLSDKIYIMIYGESKDTLPSYAKLHQDILSSMYLKTNDGTTKYDIFEDTSKIEG